MFDEHHPTKTETRHKHAVMQSHPTCAQSATDASAVSAPSMTSLLPLCSSTMSLPISASMYGFMISGVQFSEKFTTAADACACERKPEETHLDGIVDA